MFFLVVVAGNFSLASGNVDGLFSAIGQVRSGTVGLLVLVETNLCSFQHNTDLVPRSEKQKSLYENTHSILMLQTMKFPT